MSGQVLRVSTARHNACLSNHIHIHTHIHIHFCVHQNPVYVRRRESKLQKMTTPILPPRRLASHCQQSELHPPLAGPRRAAGVCRTASPLPNTTSHMSNHRQPPSPRTYLITTLQMGHAQGLSVTSPPRFSSHAAQQTRSPSFTQDPASTVYTLRK